MASFLVEAVCPEVTSPAQFLLELRLAIRTALGEVVNYLVAGSFFFDRSGFFF
jgi:hypothetical protein